MLPGITVEALLAKYPDNELVKAMAKGTVPGGIYTLTYETDKPLARIFTIDDILNDIWSDPFASKVLQRVYPKIYDYILWFRRMTLKTVLDNHKEGTEEIYKLLNDAFYTDAVSR